MYLIRVSKGIWTADKPTVAKWLSSGNRSSVSSRGVQTPSLTILFHETEIPFPPYPGLRIAEIDWECEPLERIEWVANEAMFKCAVADEFPHASGRRQVDYEAMVERALGNGWQRSGVGARD